MVIDSPATPVASAVTGTPSAFLAPFRAAVAAFAENPDSVSAWTALVQLRQQVALAIARLPRGQRNGAEVEAARELLKLCGASGLGEQPVDAEILAEANRFRQAGWPGLLAAMLFVPAWQWAEAPALDDVPSWLWSDYVRYLFQAPLQFTTVGQPERYAAHALRRLEQLARVAAKNRGSSAVRAALAAFVEGANCAPLYLAADSLRKHFELRARIMVAAAGVGRAEVLEASARAGRRLRVAFVCRELGVNAESAALLPLFEQLDSERFEVVVFVRRTSGASVEDFARSRAAEFHLLSDDAARQVEDLRAATLDVMVFGSNLTAKCDEITALASYRVAPLQVVTSSSCVTTGFPEIDLYVSGQLTETADAAVQFSERLALLPGPAHAFSAEREKTEATIVWTREALDLGGDETIFVSAADCSRVGPEVLQLWARVLAAVPGSRLLLHPFQAAECSPYAVRSFNVAVERALASHRVDPKRLVLSTGQLSRTDLKQLIAVGDVYLDTAPGDVAALVCSLEAGLPVVVAEDITSRSRASAGLVRSIGLADMVAANLDSYGVWAVQLATDRALRADVRSKIVDAMDRVPVFLDSLAASDAFGELLVRAYDELAEKGHEAFRKETRPISAAATGEVSGFVETAASLLDVGLLDEAQEQTWMALGAQPTHAGARHLMGRILEKRERPERAVDYLVAAVQGGNAASTVWRDLAGLLDRSGRGDDAITALETALRVDPSDIETWFMLGDLATRCGHGTLVREVAGVLVELSPNDPRTAQLQAEAAKIAA